MFEKLLKRLVLVCVSVKRFAYHFIFGVYFVFAATTWANSSNAPADCTTTFKATAEQIRTAHQEVVQKYFGPKKIFSGKYVQNLARSKKQTPIEIYEWIFSHIDPKIIQVETGLDAVKALLAIDSAAKVLGLSPKQYIHELRSALVLQRSPLQQEITKSLLEYLIPPLQSSLNSPKSAFDRSSDPKSLLVLSSLAGGVLYGLSGAIISGGALDIMLGSSFYGCVLGGPGTLWLSTSAGFSTERALAIRNHYKRTRLMSPEELSKKLVGTEFSTVSGVPTETEFDFQFEKLLSLAELEMEKIETLRLSVQVLGKHDLEYGRIRKRLIESPENQVYFDLWKENGGGVKTRRTLLETLDVLKKMKATKELLPLAITSPDSPFALETIKKGEAIVAFQSSSGWPKRQNFLTPVVILARGKSSNTWLAASASEFNDALKFRNTLDLFELPQGKLYFESEPAKITRYKFGDPEMLPKYGSRRNRILLPPPLKATLTAEPNASRRTLRDFVVEQYFNH